MDCILKNIKSEDLYTTSELIEMLSEGKIMGRSTIQDLIRKKHIKPVVIQNKEMALRKRYLFKGSDIIDFLNKITN